MLLFPKCDRSDRRAVCVFPLQRQCEEPEQIISALVQILEIFDIHDLMLFEKLFVYRQILVRYRIDADDIETYALLVVSIKFTTSSSMHG